MRGKKEQSYYSFKSLGGILHYLKHWYLRGLSLLSLHPPKCEEVNTNDHLPDYLLSHSEIVKIDHATFYISVHRQRYNDSVYLEYAERLLKEVLDGK